LSFGTLGGRKFVDVQWFFDHLLISVVTYIEISLDVVVSFFHELSVNELLVNSVLQDQVIVLASLCDLALVKNNNFVSVLDS